MWILSVFLSFTSYLTSGKVYTEESNCRIPGHLGWGPCVYSDNKHEQKLRITRNIKENMIAEVGNELDEGDLEGRLLKNATFSGGNRHVRVAH